MKLPAPICMAAVAQCREQQLEVTLLAIAKPLSVDSLSAVTLAPAQKKEKIQDVSTHSSLHISKR